MTHTHLPPWLSVIELPLPVTSTTVNTYLISGPNGRALVDTGMNDATSRKALLGGLEDHGLGISDIDTLVCTHYHADHAGIGQTFLEAGAQTMMSTVDAKSLALFFDQPQLDKDRVTFSKRHEVPKDFSDRVWRMFPFFRTLTEPFTPEIHLEDGQIIDLAGFQFEVVLTPGHTLGHICLRHEDGFILTGDCITSDDATHVSMRPEVVGTDPLGQFICSLERLGKLGKILGVPGHGHVIDNLPQKSADIIAHHRLRLEQVKSSLNEEPKTAFNISIEAMGDRPKAFARWLALSQTLAYLEHLVKEGQAQEAEVDGHLRYLSAD